MSESNTPHGNDEEIFKSPAYSFLMRDYEIFLWQEESACKGVDTSIFFLDEFQAYPRNTFKDYCDVCPVKEECLEFALVFDMVGVWGGTTDRDRKRIPQKTKDFLKQDYEEAGIGKLA